MTLLETITEECGNISRKVRVEYADLDDANATIFDRLKAGDYPVCLIIPFDITDSDRSGAAINSEAEVNVLMLDRFTAEQTIDKTTIEIENRMCAPMRALSRELANRMETTDIIHEDGINQVVNRSTHQALMDAHLYGNWAVWRIKFSEMINTKICE